MIGLRQQTKLFTTQKTTTAGPFVNNYNIEMNVTLKTSSLACT